MIITVKLKNSFIEINPMRCKKNKGKSRVVWARHPKSEPFTFCKTPITFKDASAPFSDMVRDPDKTLASVTDDNDNSGTASIDYAYQVHLQDEDGETITWPPDKSFASGADALESGLTSGLMSGPVIRNKPGGG